MANVVYLGLLGLVVAGLSFAMTNRQSEISDLQNQTALKDHTHRTNSHLHDASGKVIRIGGWY